MTQVINNTEYMDILNWYNISDFTNYAHRCISHRYGNGDGEKHTNDDEFRCIAADILAYDWVFQLENKRWDIFKSSSEGHGEGNDKYREAYKKKIRREFGSIKSHFIQLYNMLKEKDGSLINERIKDIHDEIISIS